MLPLLPLVLELIYHKLWFILSFARSVLWPGTGIDVGSTSGTLVPQVPVMQRADMVLFFVLCVFAGTSKYPFGPPCCLAD
jgi:hypothetical protein